MSEIARFLDMGGYAVYVWSAYGIVVAVLAANVAEPLVRQRRLLRRLAERGAKREHPHRRDSES